MVCPPLRHWYVICHVLCCESSLQPNWKDRYSSNENNIHDLRTCLPISICIVSSVLPYEISNGVFCLWFHQSSLPQLLIRVIGTILRWGNWSNAPHILQEKTQLILPVPGPRSPILRLGVFAPLSVEFVSDGPQNPRPMPIPPSLAFDALLVQVPRHC